MQLVPWRSIADWKCIGCGDCCRLYNVVINFNEWLKIVKSYGVEHTMSGLDKLYIKRSGDGSCAFLSNPYGCYRCELQHMKPRACQIWPFKVLNMPKYGFADDATYAFGEGKLFIYVDSMCSGLAYGSPTWEFAKYTLREFVEIAMGVRNIQLRTTADFGFSVSTFRLAGLGDRVRF
jgi:Fe-S-cluster containining protein